MVNKNFIFLYLIIAASHINGHGVIVHLFEWKFNDIARECTEFLAPHGYEAIQVSPINECAVLPNRPWYERYQPFSYEIASRSGNLAEFKNMVETCNKVNVHVYVDIVMNHMSGTLPPDTRGTAGNMADTAIKSYPAVPYNSDDFHKTCSIISYQNANQVRNCELDGLHDLDHTQINVQNKISTFLNQLIDIGVAGFRIDAAKHMWPEQIVQIFRQLKDLNVKAGFKPNTRPFIYQEVIDYGGEAVRFSEYTDIGHVTEFKYGRELSTCFRNKNALKWLENFGPQWNLMDSDKAIVFIDNHDTQRSDGITLTYKDSRQYKMAVGFMLSWPYGVKRVMSSYDFANHEQGPPHNPDMSIKQVSTNPDNTCNNGWICEHRWRQIYNMVDFSNKVKGTTVTNFHHYGDNQISFCRGNVGFVVFNGDNYDLNQKMQTCLPTGEYCDIISGIRQGKSCTGKSIKVDNQGMAQIQLKTNDEDGLQAYYNTEKGRII